MFKKFYVTSFIKNSNLNTNYSLIGFSFCITYYPGIFLIFFISQHSLVGLELSENRIVKYIVHLYRLVFQILKQI